MNVLPKIFKFYMLNLLFTSCLFGSLAGCDKPTEESASNVDLILFRIRNRINVGCVYAPSSNGAQAHPTKSLSFVTQIGIRNYSGSYARKSFWEHLPETKNWNEAKHKYNLHEVSAVLIEKNGAILINAGWHEGYPPSSFQFREDGLWVKDSSSQWAGPFVRVGEPREDETIYFNRIFGENCYKSNAGEHWCFHSGSIQIDGKSHKAELIPDSSEMPTYGTPVSIDKEHKSFLMFVPTNAGWKMNYLVAELRGIVSRIRPIAYFHESVHTPLGRDLGSSRSSLLSFHLHAFRPSK